MPRLLNRIFHRVPKQFTGLIMDDEQKCVEAFVDGIPRWFIAPDGNFFAVIGNNCQCATIAGQPILPLQTVLAHYGINLEAK